MLVLLALWGCGSDTDTEAVDTDVVDTDDTDDTDVAPTLTAEQQDAIVAAISKDLKKTANRGASAVQLAVWLDGHVVYEVGVGSADPEQDVEVGTDRLFQIGSDTKKLAALAVL